MAALPLAAAWETEHAGTWATPPLALAVGSTLRYPTPDGPTAARLLAVADPRPTTRMPLANGRLEATAAARRVPDATALVGRQATRGKVLSSLRSATLAHLVCHGTAEREDPVHSALHLAHGDISVDRLLQSQVTTLDLIVLSACESGVIGNPTADEAIGLPAALLAAGARGVIGASWAVSDMAAMTLFCRFWETWDHSRHPAQTLTEAQRWIRRVTNAELADTYPLHRWRRRQVPRPALPLWWTVVPSGPRSTGPGSPTTALDHRGEVGSIRA